MDRPHHEALKGTVAGLIPMNMPANDITYSDALQIMLAVLNEVVEELPEAARSALLRANQWIANGVDTKEELEARVALWETIKGRYMDQSPEVLKTRLVICALYSGQTNPPDARDTLDFFYDTAQAVALPASGLTKVRDALES